MILLEIQKARMLRQAWTLGCAHDGNKGSIENILETICVIF